MKAERITKKEITPIEIKITIETQRELEALIILSHYTSAYSRSVYLNQNLNDSGYSSFDAKEVLFMEKFSDPLL